MIDETDYLERKAASQLMDPLINRSYTAEDFAQLSDDKYDRWYPNSLEVGHALIRWAPNGNEIAEQYAIPEADNRASPDNAWSGQATPRVRPLMRIQAFQHAVACDGSAVLHYRAVTPEGTPMLGRRANRIKMVDTNTGTVEEARVVYFSPERKKNFLGSSKKIPLFKESLSSNQETLKKKIEAMDKQIKGDRTLLVDPFAVKARLGMVRSPSQKRVMKRQSAVEHYEKSFSENRLNILHPNMVAHLNEAIKADVLQAAQAQKRPEWAHIYAFVLTHLSENPQVSDNLVAAPRWFNTAMLVPECTAVWFSLNRPQALIHMRAVFEMLMDTDILKKGEYEVSIEEKSKRIQLFEQYDISLKDAMYRKPSDLAQIGAITYQLLGQVLPVSRYTVEGQTIGLPLPVINSMMIIPKNTGHMLPKPLFTPGYSALKRESSSLIFDPEKTLAKTASSIDNPGLNIKKNLLLSRIVSWSQKCWPVCPNYARMIQLIKQR